MIILICLIHARSNQGDTRGVESNVRLTCQVVNRELLTGAMPPIQSYSPVDFTRSVLKLISTGE